MSLDKSHIKYDVLMFWALAVLGCLSAWAFLACLMVQRFNR